MIYQDIIMNKLKLAFIGAGSRSFAGRTLVDVLLSEPLRAFALELVLMDVIAEQITRTEAFCRRAATQLGHPVTIRTTTVLDEAVEAYVERSRNKLLQAILLDPTVKSYRGAVAMMNELIRLQPDLLPTFI
jgi:alpha-galactosidase/6-phospho-beta-glucosidase family protein